MIVYHADSLHERIADCCPDELEPSFPQVFAHGVRLGGVARNISQALPFISDRFAVNELPDILVEASKLFLYLKEGPRVRNSRVDFEPVSYDLRICQ